MMISLGLFNRKLIYQMNIKVREVKVQVNLSKYNGVVYIKFKKLKLINLNYDLIAFRIHFKFTFDLINYEN